VIYKLFRGDEWAAARAGARFAGSPADLKDGFIHFSTAGQAAETAAKHFAGEAGLVLAEIDPARLPAPLKWEPSRGGALFPHLYGALPLSAVARTWVLALGPDGRHAFPPGLR
jgi:uncharacterized protein (DUF952 family)